MEMIDGVYLTQFFRLGAKNLEASRQYLCALDGEVGDGDHGTSMANGFAAISACLLERNSQEMAPDFLLREAAQAFLAEVGATVGPLYATGMLNAAQTLANGPLKATDLAVFLNAIADGIERRGGARMGDKTMIDAWRPAALAAALHQEGATALAVARSAAAAARKGANSTSEMIAQRGRAARLRQRALGHIDPGAASAAILIALFADLAVSED